MESKTTPRTKLLSEEETVGQRTTTKRIWKNLLVISVVFLLNFGAFRSLQSLQSTLNSEAGLGVVSLSFVSTGVPDHKQQEIVYTLFGVFLACNILAALTAGLCLDKDVKNSELSSDEPTPVSQLLLRTVRVFKDVDYVLMVPMLVIIGMSEAIVTGEITKSYVGCALGVQMVGYVMMCYCAASSVVSPLFGHLSKYEGARILILVAAAANAVLLIYMLLWQPDEDSLATILSVSGGWAVVRAVWRIQLLTVLGVMYPSNQEAVFANAEMAGSIGSMLAFAYSSALCMDVKLYIYMAVLALGTVGYGAMECKTRYKNNPETNTF
ncbi:UNC93A [Branchiostoma lanceolatum]|uniref:Protein unc-93 homolog A n=1 Tax=Branchiostoma lanceolatum TaxID=7740 RepID=A0A8J9ZCS0_BRALA|nr:UNC93A [Branchiostoma lanceolatum]